jgi:hypothetical protein
LKQFQIVVLPKAIPIFLDASQIDSLRFDSLHTTRRCMIWRANRATISELDDGDDSRVLFIGADGHIR